jgi:tetratricopeptide (TPR) repeat protein
MPHAAAQTNAHVLVMPFAATVDANAPGGAGAALWLGEAASLLLSEGLTSVGVDALSRDERAAAFERLHLPMSPVLTRATMIRVGEIIGATDVVFGDVHLGAQLDVRARAIHITNASELPVVADHGALADIFALFGRVADASAAATTGRGVRGLRASAAPMPLEGFESYVKGLVATTPASQQRFLESASRLAPADPRILMALWRTYRAQGVFDKALASANAVPGTASVARQARFAVSLSLIDLKRYDGAFRELSTLDTAGPEAAIANALGVVQLRRVAPAGTRPASEFFARAAGRAPDNADYRFNLGYAYARAENGTEALAALREAVRVDATNGDAHLVMSAVLSSAGRAAEAQRERELADLLGTHVSASTAAGKIPEGLERLDRDLISTRPLTAAIAAPAQRDQQETAVFHLSRGRDLIAARNDREATNELKRAIYLAPYEDEPHLLLGRLYQQSGQLATAIDEFKVALWCRETAAAHLALGAALLESGDRDGARANAQRALVMTPSSTEARDLLKRIGD